MDEQGREPVEELESPLTLDSPAIVRKRRPRALWAVLAVVAVVAGALVVTSADDEGNQVPGLPVDLAGAARSAAGAGEADASMLAWVEYVPGDDLPALGGEATAYRLSGDVDEARVRELADALGLEGDVESDGAGSWWVEEGGAGRLDVYSGSGASWSFFAGDRDCVTEDGSVGGCCPPNVTCKTFSSTGTAIGGSTGCEGGTDCIAPTTTYADPCSGPDGSAECHEPGSSPDAPVASEPSAACPADDALEEQPECKDVVIVEEEDTGSDCVDDDCLAPDVAPAEPPPDKRATEAVTPPDDVAEIALDVVAASGLDVSDATVEGFSGPLPEDPSGVWYVTVEPKLDGVPSGLVAYVEISDGRVLSGNGAFGAVEELGDYPLLDTRAAIDRANAQSESNTGIEPQRGEPDAGGTTGGTGSTDTGSVDDVEATEPGAEPGSDPGAATDPCVAPDGASDGCGGTTGCGGDGCVEPTTTIPCKVQPDGREICEVECRRLEESTAGTTTGGDDTVAVQPCEVTPPDPAVDPIPEPQPVEIVLVDAERSLVLFPANDGSADAYLVPAYRFTAEDGGTVDLPAVSDEALAGSNGTDTTAPEPAPEPEPVPEPQPCEVPEEGDASPTTHTVPTCPTDEDALEIGKAYYVDIDVECGGGSFFLGGRVWVTDDEEVAGWADPGERHEGGMFTLEAEDHGTFVGDANGALTAEFRTLGSNGAVEDIFCEPQPR